ncbi:hypothetical protein BaRGS_00016614 [Batillaria attramentaria]|uniref:Secreted protein n=1 Tax=Batillaria attramentaria TaxID=370345 RepID=A0ABD0KYB4_9CAEN
MVVPAPAAAVVVCVLLLASLPDFVSNEKKGNNGAGKHGSSVQTELPPHFGGSWDSFAHDRRRTDCVTLSDREVMKVPEAIVSVSYLNCQ